MNQSTVPEIIRILKESCEKAGIEPALVQHYAWQLLEVTTGRTRTQLLAQHALVLSEDQIAWLDQAIQRLRMHEPLQYIIGEVQFLTCTIKVKPPFLIPRSETEEWVAGLIAYHKNSDKALYSILDIGTGTGCIALALAQAFLDAQVMGCDNNQQALVLAQDNAQRNQVTNVTFIQSDVYESVPSGRLFDLIVSNPPYVRETDWAGLDPSVTSWEDKNAIVAADDGLALIKRIMAGAQCRLAQHGSLWIEIDIHQGKLVRELFNAAGFTSICIIKDLQGRDRLVWGQKG